MSPVPTPDCFPGNMAAYVTANIGMTFSASSRFDGTMVLTH